MKTKGTNPSFQKPFVKRVVVIAVCAGLGFGFWKFSREKVAVTRIALAEMRAEQSQCLARIEAATISLAEVRLKEAKSSERRNILRQTMRNAEAIVAKTAPESLWDEPPEGLPEWHPESPYVWIAKEKLNLFPISIFAADGSIQSAAASLLTMPQEEQNRLNSRLRKLLAEYRKAELAQVESIPEHLDGVAGSSGPKVTLRVKGATEAAKRLRGEFEQTVLEALGPDRTAVVKILSR